MVRFNERMPVAIMDYVVKYPTRLPSFTINSLVMICDKRMSHSPTRGLCALSSLGRDQTWKASKTEREFLSLEFILHTYIAALDRPAPPAPENLLIPPNCTGLTKPTPPCST